MDSELPSFLVWSLCIKCLVHHEVYSVSWSCLLSFLCNPYIPFQIYEIFYLLVKLHSALERKPCTSYQTYFSFPSPAPRSPAHAHEEKYGWLARLASYLEKVACWSKQVNQLADVASTEPHAAYAAFVFGLRHRWTFVQRTMPTADEHMDPLKNAIRSRLVQTLTNASTNSMIWKWNSCHCQPAMVVCHLMTQLQTHPPNTQSHWNVPPSSQASLWTVPPNCQWEVILIKMLRQQSRHAIELP